jgi:hypothetical protein
MSDERLDDAIRDALLADDPGAVPVGLKARMAMIPDEAAGQTASHGWRARAASFAVPAAALAAVVVIALVFGGIALRGQQTASAVPTVAPSAPQGSAPAVVPSASALPSMAVSSPTPAPAPTGPITIDPAKVTGLMEGTFALYDNMGYVRSMADTVSWPTLLAVDFSVSGKGGTLVALKNGHDIASQALTSAGVVWVETWYAQPAIDCGNRTPCAPHEYQPVSWALNLTTLAGKTMQLDHGVVSRTSVGGQTASPLPPVMAAQGDRVAYAVPRLNVKDAPEASRIIVRSLPDNAEVRTIDTTGYVAQLGVFGQALIFREAADSAGPGTVDAGTGDLNVVREDGAYPVTVASQVSDATIGDGGGTGDPRVAWTRADPTDADLYWSALGSNMVAGVIPSGPVTSGYNPVVIGDGFAWLTQVQAPDGSSSSQVNLWQPGWETARTVPGLGSPDGIISSAGQLLVSGSAVPVLQQLGAPMGAIPAAALFGTTP